MGHGGDKNFHTHQAGIRHASGAQSVFPYDLGHWPSLRVGGGQTKPRASVRAHASLPTHTLRTFLLACYCGR